MPYGVPFSEQERGRLERLIASGDRVADAMLRHDVDFPGALRVLRSRNRSPCLMKAGAFPWPNAENTGRGY